MTDKDKLIELIVKLGCEEYGGNAMCDGNCFERCKECKTTVCVEDLAEQLIANGVTISKLNSTRPSADLKGKCGSCIFAKPTVFGRSKIYVECTNAEHIRIYCSRHENAKARQRTATACKSYIERNLNNEKKK